MYNLKGFITIATLVDNAVGVVAPLGELSTRSRTFSREIGRYTHPTAADVIMTTFKSERSGTGLVPVDEVYIEHILRVAQWVYTRSVSGSLNSDRNDFLTLLSAEFSDVGDVICGNMVSDGSIWMPDYLLWKSLDAPEENLIKIWFSDNAFQAQYDEYEIVVIPPVENVDNLFQDRASVEPLLASRTMSDWMLEVTKATDADPYTALRTVRYGWVDPYSDSDEEVLETTWMVAIYGDAGDTPDNISRAIIEYILERSNYGREEWVEVLPELFSSTEFIITPLWNQYSVPNQTLVKGIYSPVARIRDLNAIARQTCVGYPDAHIASVLEHTVFVYKSLGLLLVGGPSNRNGSYVFSEQFTDYMTVPTTSHDFNRMSPKTQNWVMLIYEMLKIAEEMTEYSEIPPGFYRMKREDVMYLTATFDDIHYLVVAKSSLTE